MFPKQVMCLTAILLVSLRGIMECDFSPPLPHFNPPPPLCTSPCLSFSLLSSLLLPPCLSWGGGLSPHSDWFYWQSLREDANVARDVVLDKDGSAHKVIGKAVLFSISLKRQHLRIGTSSSVRDIHAGSFIS